MALLSGLWRTVAADNARRVAARSEPLPCALMPYPLGKVPADWGWGELEAALLDR